MMVEVVVVVMVVVVMMTMVISVPSTIALAVLVVRSISGYYWNSVSHGPHVSLQAHIRQRGLCRLFL